MIKLINILSEVSEVSPPYMYSPVGFGCHVCKFYYKQDDKHMCSNASYQEHMGTSELVDNDGNQIILDDPNPNLSIQEVLKFYSGKYPQITNASVEGPKIKDDQAIYSFNSKIGKKG